MPIDSQLLQRIKSNDKTLTSVNLSGSKIGAEGGKALAQALAQNKTLTSVGLGGNEISAEGGKALAQALAQNKTLASVDLWGNQIGAEGAQALAQALAQNKTLTWVGLRYNQIDDEGAQALAQALAQNKTLTSVNLWRNQIGAEGGKALAQALAQNKTLTWVGLSFNQIGAEGGKALAQTLAQNKTLTSVDLRSNQIDDEGAQALAQALAQNKTLTSVDLWSNKISAEGAQALGLALAQNKTLTTVDLSSNQIGAEGAKALAQALAQNKTLIWVGLSGNQIDDEGAQALAQALAQNKTLTWVDLSFNQIGAEGGKALGLALAQNKTLTSVDLWGNQIGAEGAQALAEALAQNKTLTSVNLWKNQIGDEGAQALAEALAQNKTLTWVGLRENQIGAEGGKALGLALAQNKTLTTISLSWNRIGDEGAQALAQALAQNKTLIWVDLGWNLIGDDLIRAIDEQIAANRANAKALLTAADTGQLARVKQLLASGVAVNYQDDNGNTALHLAAANSHQAIVDVLCRYPHQVILRNKKGEYPQGLSPAAVIALNQELHHLQQAVVYFKAKDYAKALKECQAAIALSPQESSHYYQRGQIYEAAGDIFLAIQDYQQAVSLNAHSPAKARIDSLLKHASTAIDYLSRVVSETPAEITPHHQLVTLLIEEKRYEEALPQLDSLLKKQPHQAEHYYHKGFILLEQEKLADAKHYFTLCLTKDPLHAKALFQRGYCLLEEHKLKQAASDIDQAIQRLNLAKQPVPAVVWFCKARLASALGNSKEAIDKYQLALQAIQQPLASDVKACLKLTMEMTYLSNYLEEARDNQAELTKATVEALLAKAEEFLEHKAYAQAKAHCQEAIALDKTSAKAYWVLGRISQQQQQWEEALAFFVTAQAHHPHYPGIVGAIANAEQQCEAQKQQQLHAQWLKQQALPEIVEKTLTGILKGVASDELLSQLALVTLSGICPTGQFHKDVKPQLQAILFRALSEKKVLTHHFKQEQAAILVYKLVERLRGAFTKTGSSASTMNPKIAPENALAIHFSVTPEAVEKLVYAAIEGALKLFKPTAAPAPAALLHLFPMPAPATSAPAVTNAIVGEPEPTPPLTPPRKESLKTKMTLFQPAPPCIASVSTVLGQVITPDTGVVAIACYKPEKKVGEHAFLLAMSLNDLGILTVYGYHFVLHPANPKLGLVDAAEKTVTISATDSLPEIIDKQHAILNQQGFINTAMTLSHNNPPTLADCYVKKFGVNRHTLDELLKNIQIDITRSKNQLMGYSNLGKGSIFNKLQSSNAHSCLSWAIAKLTEVKLQCDEHWINILVGFPSLNLANKPSGTCAMS